MKLSADLEISLRELSAAGPVELRENGSRVAPLSTLSWEIRGQGDKPLLHLWSENHNLTRRVLAITDSSELKLTLAVERFGRTRPERLEFIRVEQERSTRLLSREAFCQRLAGMFAEQFPDETLESLTISADLEHSLSGNYARGVSSVRNSRWAILAVPDEEIAVNAYCAVTFGILWFHQLRQSMDRKPLAGLRFLLPMEIVAGVAQILPALDPAIKCEIYERDATLDTFRRIDPASLANLSTRLIPAHESQLLLDRAQPALQKVLSIAPQAITIHPSVQSGEVWFRFRGYPVAVWENDSIYFRSEAERVELTPHTLPRFKQLLYELELRRSPLTSNTRHSLYRAYPERWLESLIRADVSQMDAQLDSRFVYAQVLAGAGNEHGILDLLSVTRTGRLALLELKATEFIHLPLQAASYWLRIRKHLEQGEFQRLGYFPGIELQKNVPQIYLVAPAMRFHPTTDTILRYLHPDLDVARVGLSEGWRSGLHVVLRQ